MASSKILTGPPFLFDVRTDYVKVTNDTVLVPMTLQIRNTDITFNTKDGVSIGNGEYPGPRVEHEAQDRSRRLRIRLRCSTPSELLAAKQKAASVYWKALPLRPGLYKVDIVIKDVNNPDHIGRWTRSDQRAEVRRRPAGAFVADSGGPDVACAVEGDRGGELRASAIRMCGRGFGRGGRECRSQFSRGQNLNFWMQVYNLGIDEKSKQNDATIEYQIMDLATNKPVLDAQELTTKLSPNADQVTLEKSMPLASLQPGKYQVRIKVNDGVTKQQTEATEKFSVN